MKASYSGDVESLPRCELQNLQGCKIADGAYHLDCEHRAVSIFLNAEAGRDLDSELFLLIDGERLRLHGVEKVPEAKAGYAEYRGEMKEITS